MVFFLTSSMVLGLLDQLLILSQLYLIELLGLLTNRSGATQAVTLDVSKAFDTVWHAGLLYKLIFKSYGISGQILGLISSFTSSIISIDSNIIADNINRKVINVL